MANETEDDVAAWRGVLLAQHRVVRAVEDDLDAAGAISLTVYDVLLELNATPSKCLRMQDLGERVVLSRSRVSRLVDEIERAGLVRRQPDPEDGRAVLARLTPAGTAALRKARPIYMAGIQRHFTAHLSPAERRAIASGLERVVDHHDAPSRRPLS